jgi:hypothetical protein
MLLRLINLIDQLEEEPIMIKLHNPNGKETIVEEIDGEEFYAYIFHSFYMDDNYAALPYVIEHAEQNNFDSYIYTGERLIFEQVSSDGLYFSVVCSEHVPFELQVPGMDLLVPVALAWEEQDLEYMQEACEIWSVEPSPKVLEKTPVSNVPALLMSGNFDPITPPEYAEETLENFSHGHHIVDPVGSHGVAFSDYCTRQIFHEFLEDPAGTVDSACLEDEDRHVSTILPTSVPSPFLKNLFQTDFILITQVFVPVFMLVIMLFRGVFQYIRFLWKSARGKDPALTTSELQLRIRFELGSWAFLIGSLCITIGFNIFFMRTSDAMFNSMALPAGARMVMMIPPLLVLILPVVIISAFSLWKSSRSILARFFLLLQAGFCTGTIVVLGYAGLLTALI